MDKTKIAVDVFNKHAKGYQEKFMDVSMYGDTFKIFCSLIKNEKGEILDVACGPGNITRYLLQQNPQYKILGIDLAPNMIELALINNPLSQFLLLDCKNIKMLEKKFDAIMCGFFLPYLSKEEAKQFIEDAAGVLVKDVVLYISTMEDDYSTSGFRKGSTGDEIYMHYHQADYLLEALAKNSFSVKNIERIVSKQSDGSTVTDLIIIAVK